MSIRLDPRRVNALKHLAGEAGMRPGDLVRQWVEERIDAARVGEGGSSLETRIGKLETRIAALEGASARPAAPSEPGEPGEPGEPSDHDDPEAPPTPVREPEAEARSEDEDAAGAADAAGDEPEQAAPEPAAPKGRRRASAAPAARVALHDEMIAVISERGPMTAGELAAAVSERGRYAPPRSGRSIDAAMISQRASNPTYRSRFLRREGRIGLAEGD